MEDDVLARFAFAAVIVDWRGPAPFFFAPVPDACLDALRAAARAASYGWGCVPVEAKAGEVAFTTSLFPKDGGYLLPLKAAVRKQIGVTAGDKVAVEMTVKSPKR